MIVFKRLFFCILCVSIVFACKEKRQPLIGKEYTGVFLGKPYVISVVGDTTNYRFQIDSIIGIAEYAFNVADSNSVLARFNRFKETNQAFVFRDSAMFFGLVFDLAKDLSNKAGQFYDPTTNPIKKEWMVIQFNRSALEPNLDSLFKFVGFHNSVVDLNEVYDENQIYTQSILRKSDPRVELDLNNFALAYGLQCIADFFRSKGLAHYHIHCENYTFNHGALLDSLTQVPFGLTNDVNDQKIRLLDGAFVYKTPLQKQSMLDPTYGYPVDNEVVYVGVVSKSLAESEVYSESFMIMGYEQCGSWYEQNPDANVQSFVWFKNGDTLRSASTEGFDQMIIVPEVPNE